jgi:HEAT repeat protein
VANSELLKQLESSDPETAMEAAKAILAHRITIPRSQIERIAAGTDYADWSRAAAIYLLGNLRSRKSAVLLARILEDEQQNDVVRDYAAEALGNIGDPAYLPLISRIATQTSSPEIRQSCEFALEEIPAAEARRARSP